MNDSARGARCRRCGGLAEHGAFVHHLWLASDEGPRHVALPVCARCAAEFPDVLARDEYVRHVLLGH